MITRKARKALWLKRQGKAKTVSGLTEQDFADWEREDVTNAIAKLTPEDIEALAVEAADKAERRSRKSPGPWTNELTTICDVFRENSPNARLIAAAPDLLAACKDMLSYIEDYASSADEDDPVHELLPRYRAAIAKAEGKQE